MTPFAGGRPPASLLRTTLQLARAFRRSECGGKPDEMPASKPPTYARRFPYRRARPRRPRSGEADAPSPARLALRDREARAWPAGFLPRPSLARLAPRRADTRRARPRRRHRGHARPLRGRRDRVRRGLVDHKGLARP